MSTKTLQPHLSTGFTPEASGAPNDAVAKRRAWLDRLLARSWRRGWSAKPSLAAEVLIARAIGRAGSDDFGPEGFWRDNLEVLTRSLQTDAALTPLGRTIAHGQLVGALGTRLAAQALWRRHPEILDQPVSAPIIVLGHMRSGTTRLQRLLACDSQFAHTRFYESWNPVPHRRLAAIDDRRVRSAAALATVRMLNPDFFVLHPTSVTAPDEEIGFHSVSLFGSPFEAQWRIPDFARHCEAVDARPVYREFRRLLQTVAWLRGSSDRRPWILKVPQFTQDLPALLGAFPDARLLCIDRDRAQVVASSASLVRNQMTLQSDAVDCRWIGQEWTRKVALRDERLRRAREAATVPQLDLRFDAMNADWQAAMRRVYAFLERPLHAETLAKMTRYGGRTRRHRLHRHRYSPAEFGLDAA